MLEKRKTFRGGYVFKNLEGAPKSTFKDQPSPKVVYILLKQGFGEEVKSTVKAGDVVKRGQIIGRDDNVLSSPVHASLSGKVKEISTIGEDSETSVVIIEADGSDTEEALDGATANFADLEPEKVQELLYLSGVTGLATEGFPSTFNSSVLPAEDVKFILINAVPTEPFMPENSVLLQDKIDDFITGLQVLQAALPSAKLHVGFCDRDTDLFAEIDRKTNGKISFHPLKGKFPQEDDRVLAQTILGLKKVKLGAKASDLNAVVLDVQAVLHAYEAVVQGKSVTEQTLVLGGNGFKENFYIRVPIGTPVSEFVTDALKDNVSSRLILGGLMKGLVIGDTALPVSRVDKAITAVVNLQEPELFGSFVPGAHKLSITNTFLSALLPGSVKTFNTSIEGEHRPCIQCNLCEDVCPVNIIPHWISKCVTHELLEDAEKFRIFDCIECGLCNLVCPSKIPLLNDIKQGKAQILEEKASEEAA